MKGFPTMRGRHLTLVAALVVLTAFTAAAGATCGCPGGGSRDGCCGEPGTCAEARGCGRGPRGMNADDDRAVFHFLLDAGDRIRRDVTALPDGVETLTESDDPGVAAKIETHVRAMAARMKAGRPIHGRDPLFRELFRHADAIVITIEPTAHGVRVRETSQDPWVVKLIRAHADVVGGFLTRGHAEMRRDHDPPPP